MGDRELDGQVAIVTGAGRRRGIGRMIALALAHAGASVVVTGSGRSTDTFPPDERALGWRDAHSVVAEIEGLGGRGLAVVTDLTEEASCDELISRTVGEMGRLDIVVNNAASGRGADRVPVVDLTYAEWQRVYAINVDGTFCVSRAAARHLLTQGDGGSIISISSVGSKRAPERSAAYSSSKAAVDCLARVMALELASAGIRVNSLCPGFTDTARQDDIPKGEAFDAFVRESVPLGYADDGTATADAVVFLASDRGRWITGQSINIDGGWVWGR